MIPVLLWTDVLVYLLVAAIVGFVFSLRRNPENRSRWRQVFSTHTGMVTFAILLFYILIALSDSLHFRKALAPVKGQPADTVYYANEVNSVLDLLLGDMGRQSERTYSAPFALHAFAKENIRQKDGETTRDYPRLTFGGAHLEHIDERGQDIVWQSLLALLKGLAISALLIVPHWFCGRRRKAKEEPLPWLSAYLAVTALICLFVWLIQLGGSYHVLGTDQAGDDTLYASVKGIRTGVLIGTLATLIMMPIAITLGIVAGYFKGWVDDVVQYLYITLSSIPGILLIAASVLLFQVYIDNNPSIFEVGLEKADARFVALCFILGVTSWATLCRLLRAETLKISQLEYVQAAHAFGVSHFRIITRHIMPNLMHIILITFVLDFSSLVLAEAVLSYIGVGIDSSMASWGNMINMARTELSREPVVWWNLAGAFIFMFLLVLAANLFSDLVNDAFDPKTRLEAATT